MSYKQIKWLILLIPTITIGLWEYVRHEFLLPYLSMEMGNLLAPVIVFFVTMVFVVKLFRMMEKIRGDLEREREQKIILEEREMLSRELHDGIAQSLFLLSVNMNQLEKSDEKIKSNEIYQKVKKTAKHIHDDVRQAIFNLRNAKEEKINHKESSIKQLISNSKQEMTQQVHISWDITDDFFSPVETIELYACIKEALMNIRKHSKAENIWISANANMDGWVCKIEDDGVGFNLNQMNQGYGIAIMKDRAKKMSWSLSFSQNDDKTTVKISKENKK